jgi:propanol-preferring alcohol dehydrogenase
MPESGSTGRVTATPAARKAITALRAASGGRLMFVQSAGCCDGSEPMCFGLGEFAVGDHDLLLGVLDDCPFHIDADLYNALGRPRLVLDAEPGSPGGFSLAAGEGLHFVARVLAPAESTAHVQEEKTMTMKAAVVTDFGKPLEIRELPVPEPGPGQVLVRMEASGLCHTDIHAAHGDWPVKPTPPFVPGHEGVGPVERIGAGVPETMLGKRVAVPWLGSSCGSCRYCVTGWETLCESQVNTGYSVDGCYAEYVVADARAVVAVPDGVTSLDAAPLTCAGVTTYKAIKVARVVPAERVAVFGIGGLGHLAVQYARIVGAFVTAVDIEPEKLGLAQQLGADHVVNARTHDPVEEIKAVGGADVAVVLAASPTAFEQAYRSLNRGGRLVCVALPADDAAVQVPIFETVLGGISVIGSIVGTRQDLAEVFALHAAGRTRVIAETRRLDEVNDCFAEVLDSRAEARLVFEF